MTDDDRAFEIEIRETGQVVRVARGQTALAALTEAGLDVPSSCEEGICGTCRTQVISGTPVHRDQFLTETERAGNRAFMPCCSRSDGERLVITLED